MIAYLEGRVLSVHEDGCVLLTAGGVGYEVHLTAPALSRLPAVGQTAALHTSTIVREDSLDLYGFESADERETFNILLSIAKLGPTTALATLAVYGPEELRGIAAGEDPLPLTRVPGIGKKSAQHIFLELKYKLKAGTLPGHRPTLEGGAAVFRDALAGLVNLGYAEEEVRPALDEALRDEPDLDVAGALRQALKTMARKR